MAFKDNELQDFTTHPVWVEIKKRLKEQRESLDSRIHNDTLEAIDTLRVEYNVITRLLQMPKDFREEEEEE